MLALDLEGDQKRPGHALDSQQGPQRVSDEPRVLRCRRCRSAITHPEALFAMRHTSPIQVFPNPAGILYEIWTARHATGLTLWGSPTPAFTWFVGYAWQVASCARCGVHLGWCYSSLQGEEPAIFYGLLCQQLGE